MYMRTVHTGTTTYKTFTVSHVHGYGQRVTLGRLVLKGWNHFHLQHNIVRGSYLVSGYSLMIEVVSKTLLFGAD